MKKVVFLRRVPRRSLCAAFIFCVCAAALVVDSCASPPAAPKSAPPPVSKPTPPKSAAKPDTFLNAVYAKLERGDNNGALALFNGLSAEDAAKSRNMMLKSSILFSMGKLADAREAAQSARDAASKTDERVDAEFALANIAGAEGKTKEQKALLDGILKISPAFVPALNAAGSLALQSSDFRAAGQYYDSALKAAPQDIDALIGRAAVYRLQRKPKDALKRLNEAVHLYPSDSQALAQRGRLLREMGVLNDALADLDKAKELNPRDYWISYDRGRTLLALDKKRDALAEFERAEKINPDIFVSYVYSAGIRDEFGEHKTAMRDYEKLVKIKPDYFFGFEMLGIHYMREKRFADARDAFRAAYSKAPEMYNYALLVVINGLYAGDKQSVYKPFIEEIMRKIDRSNIEYVTFRLFYDFAGESDIVRRTNTEKDLQQKAKNLFYLANYYGVRGNSGTAQKFFNDFKGLQRRETLEWRVFEMVFDEESFKSAAASSASKGNS